MLTAEDRQKFGRTMAYYVLQSERIESTFRLANTNFLAALALGIVLVGAAYVGSKMLPLSSTLQLAVALTVGLCGWAIACMVLGALVRSAKDAPHGLSGKDAMLMTLLGPFRPMIVDYLPDAGAKPANSR